MLGEKFFLTRHTSLFPELQPRKILLSLLSYSFSCLNNYRVDVVARVVCKSSLILKMQGQNIGAGVQ